MSLYIPPCEKELEALRRVVAAAEYVLLVSDFDPGEEDLFDVRISPRAFRKLQKAVRELRELER